MIGTAVHQRRLLLPALARPMCFENLTPSARIEAYQKLFTGQHSIEEDFLPPPLDGGRLGHWRNEAEPNFPTLPAAFSISLPPRAPASLYARAASWRWTRPPGQSSAPPEFRRSWPRAFRLRPSPRECPPASAPWTAASPCRSMKWKEWALQ